MAHEPLNLRLDGFEGPLDLLLELVRGQKMDLSKVAIPALVDQFLAVLDGERRIRPEIACEWLVMAAHLVWLKSKLLVPEPHEPDEEAVVAAEDLAERLKALERVRGGARLLGSKPLLGRDTFARGEPERLVVEDRSQILVEVGWLMRAYVAARRRSLSRRAYRPKPRRLFSVQEALRRIGGLLPAPGSEAILDNLVPGDFDDPVERRAAISSTLIAGLEMARGGDADLIQEAHFAPIRFRRLERAVTGADDGEAAVSESSDIVPDHGVR